MSVNQVGRKSSVEPPQKLGLSELSRRNAIRLQLNRERKSNSTRAVPTLMTFIPDMLRTELHDLATIAVSKHKSRDDISLVIASHDLYLQSLETCGLLRDQRCAVDEAISMSELYGTEFSFLNPRRSLRHIIYLTFHEMVCMEYQNCTEPDISRPHQTTAQVQTRGRESSLAVVQVPRMENFQGALLLADVTGFTRLTEHISQTGKAGIEILTNCMNSYFSQIIDLVHSCQGDVIRFAGDSVICAFRPKGEDLLLEDRGLRKATAAAVECASAMSYHLGKLYSSWCLCVPKSTRTSLEQTCLVCSRKTQ